MGFNHVEGKLDNKLVPDSVIDNIKNREDVDDDSKQQQEHDQELARVVGEIMMGRNSLFSVVIANAFNIKLERLTVKDGNLLQEITADIAEEEGITSRIAWDALGASVYTGAQLVSINDEEIEADTEKSYYPNNARKNQLADRVHEFMAMDSTFAQILQEKLLLRFKEIRDIMHYGDLKKYFPTP